MLTITAPPTIGIDDDKITQREAARLLGVSFPTASRYMTKGWNAPRFHTTFKFRTWSCAA